MNINMNPKVSLTLKLALSLLLLLGMTATNALAVDDQPRILPVIEYQFDDQSDFEAGVVRNHYFTNYTGTIHGPAVLTLGVLGNSIQMNDSDVYVEIPGSELLDFSISGLTVEASVMRFLNTNEDAVISKWYAPDQFLLTFYSDGNGRLVFSVGFSDGTYGSVEYAIPDTSYLEQWVRVSATYARFRIGSRLQLFWNGQRVAGRFFLFKRMASGNIPIHIGDANNEWSRFNGSIDEVRIWARELPSTEIGAPLRRN
jgi:hypothetical protein